MSGVYLDMRDRLVRNSAPLPSILAAIEFHEDRFASIELNVVLQDGVNDSDEDLAALAQWWHYCATARSARQAGRALRARAAHGRPHGAEVPRGRSTDQPRRPADGGAPGGRRA